MTMTALIRRCLGLLLLISLAACSQGAAPGANTATLPATSISQANPTSRATATLPAAPGNPTIPPAADPSPPAPPSIPTLEPDTGSNAGFSRDLALATPRMEGADVQSIQARLLELGYSGVGAADGIFGPLTEAAVKEFQAANGLPISGVVDAATWDYAFGPSALGPAEVAPSGAPGGLLFYLDTDGKTIKTIRPDGTDQQTLLVVDKLDVEIITHLSADPAGKSLIYGVSAPEGNITVDYFLVQGGVAKPLFAASRAPVWSPDRTRLLVELFDENTGPGLHIYDLASGAMEDLGLDARASWFPDGQQLVLAGDDIAIYNLASNNLTPLTNLANPDNPWYIEEAHVMPDGQTIQFYAGQQQNVGASGNGMQWWSLPVAGGELTPITEPGGNGVHHAQFNPEGTIFSYIEGGHVSACASQQDIYLRPTNPADSGPIPAPSVPNMPFDGFTYINGLTWDPANTGWLAFGAQSYVCTPDFGQHQETPAIYTWDLSTAVSADDLYEARMIVEGSLPVWIRP